MAAPTTAWPSVAGGTLLEASAAASASQGGVLGLYSLGYSRRSHGPARAPGSWFATEQEAAAAAAAVGLMMQLTYLRFHLAWIVSSTRSAQAAGLHPSRLLLREPGFGRRTLLRRNRT